METTRKEKPIRKIVHVGVDCFYAAVMMRNDPSLQGNPLVVVSGDSAKKNLICSANYEARKLGIHAGMKSFRAKELCPQIVILLSEMDAYQNESKKIRGIFHRFTDMVEPLSLDEAFLDLSGSDKFKGNIELIATEIRKLIHEELKINASIGIASNKFLAKVASDWKKPNGQFSITPDMIDSFILKLPVRKIWDIGKETTDKMASLGINTCGALQKLSLNELDSNFGNIGRHLYDVCRGIDDSPVDSSKEPNPLSIEEMFRTDIQIVDETKDDVKQGDLNGPSSSKPTSTKTDEHTQEMSKIHASVFEQLKNAAVIFIEFKEKRYRATLAKKEPGKHVLFSISKPDTYISMKVSDGAETVLRLVTSTGAIVAFKTNLIQKRLPLMIFKTPLKDSKGFVRISQRIPTNINASIICKKLKKVTESGTIISVSDGGCSFTTDAVLNVDDEIELLVLLPVEKVKKEYRIHGTIRSMRTVKSKDEMTNYGIESLEDDRKTLVEIKEIVESQKTGKEQKTTK